MENNKFTKLDWATTTNIYEVNLRQYTPEGTIQSFSKHLPRLKEMGVHTLWFMPLTPIAIQKRLGSMGSYYACADYTSINPEFGTPADFKNLVSLAHALGFKIMIDWVANHTGYGHTWTKSNPEFYLKDNEGNFVEKNGWQDVIHLDFSNANLQNTMIEAMLFWVNSFDIDGFRCDMAHLVPLHFWQQARTTIDAEKKLFWLAECEEPNYHQVFDATYSWQLLHTMEKYANAHINMDGLLATLQQGYQRFPADALRLLFTSNHDENSHSGSEYERMGEAAKCFAVLTCSWNGLPLIYSGQEAANTKRLLFFDKDCIDWSNGFALQSFYKTLLHLHSTHPALIAGNPAITTYQLATDTNDKVFAFLRKNGEDEVLVLLNVSPHYFWANLIDERVGGWFEDIFTHQKNDITTNRYFEMKPWGWYVYKKDGSAAL